ncbi:hypothetical protein SAMN05216203_2810 [Marinobacter daqiaonensis]|uniref:Uncharacterized protein n=1 Tax=Marinobacter daqiaonensis TaxID=650891 RepID=A0A1I6J9N8_9GAMM|nr:hypothetical protein [Marinobacter daqiaonensis]SFR75676.1 hypothetical protein SAMN05216203_2810 [Marinobacter daqiaonensis]
MSRIVSSLVFSMTLALLSLSAQAIDLADSPLLLKGEKDVEAIIAPTGDGTQALVRITGLNHPTDGVVFLTDIEKRENDGRAYRAEVDGKVRSLILYAPSYWANAEYSTHVPGLTGAIGLMPVEKTGEKVDLRQLVAEYEQQKGKGVQAELARFDRKKAAHRQEEVLQEIDKSASQVCNSPITTRVEWATLSDEQLNALSISGYCGQVASEMEYLCAEDKGVREDLGAISAVECHFSDKLELRRKDNTLVFATSEDETNQRDRIRDFLKNL